MDDIKKYSQKCIIIVRLVLYIKFFFFSFSVLLNHRYVSHFFFYFALVVPSASLWRASSHHMPSLLELHKCYAVAADYKIPLSLFFNAFTLKQCLQNSILSFHFYFFFDSVFTSSDYFHINILMWCVVKCLQKKCCVCQYPSVHCNRLCCEAWVPFILCFFLPLLYGSPET